MAGEGPTVGRTAGSAACGVEVRRKRAGLYLAALRPYGVGERIVDLDGTLTAAPSRFSLQVGPAEHVEAPAGTPLEAGCDRFRWRATNHSCRPNSLVVGRSIVSCRPVGADDEVTIHYEATEWELTSTFRCTCGWCRGREIRGFRHLTVAQRSALEELIADHLRPFVGPSAS